MTGDGDSLIAELPGVTQQTFHIAAIKPSPFKNKTFAFRNKSFAKYCDLKYGKSKFLQFCLFQFHEISMLQLTLIKQYGCFKLVHFSTTSVRKKMIPVPLLVFHLIQPYDTAKGLR